ncbi:MAG: segregation/condensation protein A, partial [Aquificaceae bacterium]
DALEELREVLLEKRHILSFYELILGKSLVPYLMALMVLYQDGLVEIEQDEPYGDLRIRALEEYI